MKRVATLALIAAGFIALPANAATCFEVVGRVMMERVSVNASGQRIAKMTPVAAAAPGDQLVLQFDYWNVQPYTANTMVLTNPVPDQLVYVSSDTPGETVSVDGGRSYGKLEELTVTDAAGLSRPAQNDDVTHVRWVLNQDIPSGSGGQLAFRAVMRDPANAQANNVQFAMR